MNRTFDTIVIGGGQAGLAAGYWLRKAGANFLILEKGQRPVGSWESYYDSLTLFSPARYSSLPGLAFPGDPDRYPARDEVVDYLAAYAETFALPVETGAEVRGVQHSADAFLVSLADGRALRARSVIMATGAFHFPFTPPLPGADGYLGKIVHSAHYRNPQEHHGQKVIVVGSRNSAIQIAYELALEPQVDASIASLQPPKFMPQRVLGKDFHFWAKWTGFDLLPPSLGGTSDRLDVLDDGRYKRAFAEGLLIRKPMFSGFTERGVVWSDGSRERVDTVVFATGFRLGHHLLAAMPEAVGSEGGVLHRGGVSTTIPGLYFLGMPSQRNFASATIRGAGRDAKRIARHLRKHLTMVPAGSRANQSIEAKEQRA